MPIADNKHQWLHQTTLYSGTSLYLCPSISYIDYGYKCPQLYPFV